MQLGQDDNCFVYMYVDLFMYVFAHMVQMSSHCLGTIYDRCVSEFYNVLREVLQLFGRYC